MAKGFPLQTSGEEWGAFQKKPPDTLNSLQLGVKLGTLVFTMALDRVMSLLDSTKKSWKIFVLNF